MLGDIFGLSAGLTRFELTLFRFLGFRAGLSSFLPFVIENAGLVGVDIASSMGLGLLEVLAPGVLKEFNFGVFLAAIRGVSSSVSWIAVVILESAGRSMDASGKVRSSSMGGASVEALKLGEGCIRMRDAGVAGVAPDPFICAIRAGEAARDPGLGGGPISDSIGSGEMESVCELSRVLGASSVLEDDCADRASCMSSETSFGGISEETLAFRRFGFTTGDCRMRPLPFAVRGRLLLFVLRNRLPCSCDTMAGSPRMSMSISIGEWPVELPEVV